MNSELKFSPRGFMFALCICQASNFVGDKITKEGLLACIFQYISNKMQRYRVYLYLETTLHVSSGTSTHHQEHIQLYLQHLVFVRPLLLPAAIVVGSSNGLTNTRCCRYRCMCSWWWVGVPPETRRAVSRYKLCNVASCWIYSRIYLRCTDS